MKKVFLTVCCVLFIIAGIYFAVRLLGADKPLAYKEINLGWAKTSLPFALWQNPQAKLMMQVLNDGSSELRDTELYLSLYDKKKFSMMVLYAEFDSASKIHPKQNLADSISNAGFKSEAKQAFKHAQYTKENGAIKYSYQTETKLSNTPLLLVSVSCTKGRKTANFFGVGKNTPENKEIVEHFLAETECFPEKK